MARKQFVREGQQYAETSRFFTDSQVWEVESIYQTAAGIPHARLVNVRDPLETKTISCRVLADDNFYRLVRAP